MLALVAVNASRTATAAEPAVRYDVRIEGAGALREFLLEVSETNQLASRPPPSVTSLRLRARRDVPELQRALRSRGYYDAKLEVEIDADTSPVVVLFRVQPGPRYRFGELRILEEPPDASFAAPEPAAIGLSTGAPALARSVLDAERKLLQLAKQTSYALAEMQPRRVVVDHASRTMDVELSIRPGPKVRLAEPDFTGGDGVDPEYLKVHIPWSRGDLYRPELLEKARLALVDTNLFVAVRVRPGLALNSDALLPVAVELVEREHRTVKLSLAYSTDKGPGVRAGWWHRNFFGAGEQLSGEGIWSPVESELKGSYRKPHFLRPDQAFVTQLSLTQEDTDAYFSTAAKAALGVERKLKPGMDLSVGGAFRYSNVEPADDSASERFGLLSVPVHYSWDFSDDLLDPTRGGRLGLTAAPYRDLLGSGLNFAKVQGRYSHYLSLRKSPRLILAGRVALGSIFGASRDEIPADERFYAGGGGSIRGFGYQLASPLDEEGNPVGGNALVELSAELRWRFTDTLGAVGFVDAGGAFESAYPDTTEDLNVGYGIGFRYHSPMGPVRLDVGFPADPREGVDDPYQLYISIGQAF
jgi:translocation and assembly module TamA